MKISKRLVNANMMLIFLVIILFQFFIGRLIPLASYSDEILVLILLCIFLHERKLKILSSDIYFIFLCLLVFALGVLSNILSGVTDNFIFVFLDYISIIKTYIIFFLIIRSISSREAKWVLSKLYPISCFYIIVAFLCVIFGYVANISFFFKDETSIRYGLRAYSFIAENASSFGCLIIGLYTVIQAKERKSILNLCAKNAALILLLLTTKGPQIFYVAILIVFHLLHTKKIRIWHIGIVLLLGVVLGRYQIINYFLNENSARFLLAKTAFLIANRYFPLGSGFATFGSDLSRTAYSSLYREYGLSKVYGLSRDYGAYITDNYWPMVLAQLGYIGILAIVLMIHYIYTKVISTKYDNIEIKQSILALLITFLVGSLGSAYFNTSAGVFCFSIVGLILNSNRKQNC